MPSGSTISNSSCLIGLESIGRLDILEALYGTVIVPLAVSVEFGVSMPNWIQVQPVNNLPLAQSLAVHLGAGEAEAIALAIESSAQRLILDDKQARTIARRFKLPITGTLGVLLNAKQRGIVGTVRDILDALSAANFRISGTLRASVLAQAGE